jgi:hypothetical protein
MLANSVSAALGLGSEKDGERTERLSSRSYKPHCSGIPTSDQQTQRPSGADSLLLGASGGLKLLSASYTGRPQGV